MLDFSFQNEYPYNMKTNRKERKRIEMKVFSINCTNLKYNNTFNLGVRFSSEEKAIDFIKYLDEKETRWDYDYEIVEESII